MKSRLRNERLNLEVERFILQQMPHLESRLEVNSLTDGTVYLSGYATNHSERDSIKQLAGQVSGVKQVFCHVAIRS
jgi:osmotically-inducible protein OsmY